MFAGDVIGIVVAAVTADFVMTDGAATQITIVAAAAADVVDLIEIVVQDYLNYSYLDSDSISAIVVDSVDVIDSIALSRYSMSIDASNCHHHTAGQQKRALENSN